MKKIVVVITNGKPGSGKTLIQSRLMNSYGDDYDFKSMSSVDKIKKIYRELGWDYNKTDAARADIHALKQMYIRTSNGPTKDLVELVVSEANSVRKDKTSIIFYDCRESVEIDKAIDALRGLKIIGVHCKTMLVRRYNVDTITHNNDGDDNIDMDISHYDIVVNNDEDKNTNGFETLINKTMKQILEV